jgi:putative transcriptional regulator
MKGIDKLQGQFLIAMPNMGDPRFERGVVYLCAHTREGAMGFIVNKVLEKPSIPDFLHQLNIIDDEEKRTLAQPLAATPLHNGGPVEPGRGFVLHSPDYSAESTLAIDGNISLTATLEILRAIVLGRGPKRAMIALGYSGWASGQLEEEIAGNAWIISKADPRIIFDGPHEEKYDRALKQMGINPHSLSSQAGHA